MQNQEYCSLGGIGWWLLEADFVLNGFNGVVAVGLDVDEDVHAGFLECFHIVGRITGKGHHHVRSGLPESLAEGGDDFRISVIRGADDAHGAAAFRSRPGRVFRSLEAAG